MDVNTVLGRKVVVSVTPAVALLVVAALGFGAGLTGGVVALFAAGELARKNAETAVLIKELRATEAEINDLIRDITKGEAL